MKKGALSRRIIAMNEIFLLVVAIAAFGFVIGEAQNASAGDDGPVNEITPPSASLVRVGGNSATKAIIKETWVSKNGVFAQLQINDDLGVLSNTKVTGLAKEGESYFARLAEKSAVVDGVKTDIVKISKQDYDAILKTNGADFVKEGAYTTKYPLIGEIGVGWAHLVDGIVWAGVVAGAIQLIFPLLGAEDELTNAASAAAIAGIMSYQGLRALGPSGFEIITDPSSFFLEYAGGIGLAVAAVTFVLLYKKESKKVVELRCLPWEAPLGGGDCEKCNQDPVRPCSEYRCKSLGQACDIVNAGTSEERCTWVSRNDVSSPTITPWKEALSENHQYTKHDTRPPSLGTKIIRNDKTCILPFTPLEFGVVLNEPGQCKIDYVRANGTNAFDEMKFYFGESNLYRYNHTQKMRLPSPSAFDSAAESAGAPELKNDGNYNLYVRCRDANGNVNTDDFVFSFCVDKSPDTTPPVIESTSIVDGSPVSFEAQSTPISVFVNEPAECKWSIQDKSYDNMENEMLCSKQIYEQNANQLYPCTSTLTGIKDRENNKFYFRCKDQPGKPESERNVNTQSHVLNLRGSQPLNILRVGPNETIRDNVDSVKVNLNVETSNGAENGKAACYFSSSGNEGSYVLMFETNKITHRQTLSLGGGEYNYFFRCIDAGGNADSKNTSFGIVIDKQAPIITRAYKQEPDALKLVTNEDAECAYTSNSCNFNFDDGLKFIYNPVDEKKNHFVKWEANKVYYIKCRDSYGNQPAPNSCSMVVNAAQLN